MSYIVLTRNPSNKKLIAMEDEDFGVMEFDTEEKANHAARSAVAFEAWGYEIIEVVGSPVRRDEGRTG